MITIYGIKNCDTMKKAMKWLDTEGLDYSFYDYRVEGIDPKLLESLEKNIGWQSLLNKRSTTWRQLDEGIKNAIQRDSALQLMLEKPTLIKRPLLQAGQKYLLGFKPEHYKKFLAASRQ